MLTLTCGLLVQGEEVDVAMEWVSVLAGECSDFVV